MNIGRKICIILELRGMKQATMAIFPKIVMKDKMVLTCFFMTAHQSTQSLTRRDYLKSQKSRRISSSF